MSTLVEVGLIVLCVVIISRCKGTSFGRTEAYPYDRFWFIHTLQPSYRRCNAHNAPHLEVLQTDAAIIHDYQQGKYHNALDNKQYL